MRRKDVLYVPISFTPWQDTQALTMRLITINYTLITAKGVL
jgi:hypothetical protein